MHRQCRFIFVLLILAFSATVCESQGTYVPLNDDYYHLLERYELKSRYLSRQFHSGIKPYDRKAVAGFIAELQRNKYLETDETDRANFQYINWSNWEWTADTSNVVHGRFYRQNSQGRSRLLFAHPSDLYSHNSDEYDLHVNPVTDNFLGKDTDLGRMVGYSSRGLEVRGMVSKRIGFYSFIADNQGLFPGYVQHYADSLNFPGEGLTKIAENKSVDFFSARGYVTFNIIKNVDLQFGHDKNFIGNGQRSLFLSDNSAPYLFLKLNTHIGRFNYTNIWSSMINNQDPVYYNLLRKKKYAAMHHLSINVTDRLNIGFFEAEVFSRDSTGGGFDFHYANPIIFYRFVESYLGSSDNALIGIDFKWLPMKGASLYGQAMIDEFLSRDLFNKKKSWTRKYAFQLGSKLVDAFTVPKLDLQLEYNVVFPYTYSHRDGGRNYMHYKQPLAHPMGANFNELLSIARYQVNDRLSVIGTLMFARKGLDVYGRNYGSDLTLDYDTRYASEGVVVGQGLQQQTNLFDLRVSYRFMQNLFVDYRMMHRKENSRISDRPDTGLITLGVRYNMPFRQQLF